MSIQWIAQLIPNIYLQNHTGCDLSIRWRYIQLLYNWRLYFIFINCLSVRLLQAVILLQFFSPSNQKLYWKGKKSTNKNKHIKQTFYIRLKRLTSAGAVQLWVLVELSSISTEKKKKKRIETFS